MKAIKHSPIEHDMLLTSLHLCETNKLDNTQALNYVINTSILQIS